MVNEYQYLRATVVREDASTKRTGNTAQNMNIVFKDKPRFVAVPHGAGIPALHEACVRG